MLNQAASYVEQLKKQEAEARDDALRSNVDAAPATAQANAKVLEVVTAEREQAAMKVAGLEEAAAKAVSQIQADAERALTQRLQM